MIARDPWAGYDLGLWSREPPTVPGPYYMFSNGCIVGVAYLTARSSMSGQSFAITPLDLCASTDMCSVHVYPVEDYRDALWHPWQSTPPAPPKKVEVDPGPGVWTNRPWREGLHRVHAPGTYGGSADVYVGAGPRENAPVTSFFGLAASVNFYPKGARWYRYPDPPEDTER